MTATPQTLFDKLWHSHLVDQNDDGECLIYVDRHLVHEVTSPQAFEGLRLAGRKPWRPETTLAVADHNAPTVAAQHSSGGVEIDARDVQSMVTWGTSPDMVAPIDGCVPDPAHETDPVRRASMQAALAYMDLAPGTPRPVIGQSSAVIAKVARDDLPRWAGIVKSSGASID